MIAWKIARIVMKLSRGRGFLSTKKVRYRCRGGCRKLLKKPGICSDCRKKGKGT